MLKRKSELNSGREYIFNNYYRMKIFLSVLIIFFASQNIFSQKKLQNFYQDINKVLSDDFFSSSQIAIDVFDLTTREPLYQKNEKLLFRPASNLKILTSISGLLLLGPDYNFTTALYHTGYIRDHTLYGDLYIAGGFDPLLSTPDLDTLLTGLKQAGVRNISGNIYADVSKKDSLFWGAGWMWDDDPSTDAPYLSTLNINENSVKVAYQPSLIDSLVYTNLIPGSDFFTLKNTAVTIRGDSSKVKVNREWIDRKNNILVSGYLPYYAKADTDSVNVYNPPMYCLHLFKETLFRNHISFNGILDTATIEQDANLVGLYNRPYRNVLSKLNKDSDNLVAEMTLYALAYKYNLKPVTAKEGVKALDSLVTLAGFDPANYRIVDGSGVSHYNLVSSELLLGTLKYIYYNEPGLFTMFYNSLPVAGVDGTLEKRMIGTKAENNIHAKTGTISGVSCLSGYVRAANGHDLAFSIMIQNYVVKARIAKSFEDSICKILAGYK